MSNNNYKSILNEIKKIAYIGPPAPKGLNIYTIQTNPFHVPVLDIFANKNKLLSEKYNSVLKGIPIPKVITRHILQPIKNLETETGLGKVVGFKIEAKGRTGSRSMKRGLSYGMLDGGMISSVNGSLVDYAQSAYTTKRGATGVKVWVQYGRK
jgi:hypothetical protein